MYEDEPQDRVHDVLADGVFGDAPARPPRARRGRGDRLDPGPRHRRLPPAPATPAPTSSSAPPATSSTSAIVELAERLVFQPDRRRRWRLQRRRRPRAAPASASTRRRPSSTTSASARPASAATTSGATRSRCSTRSSAARPPRGCSARCARSAAWPTRSAPTTHSSPTRARSRPTSAPARTTSRRPAQIIGRRARRAALRAGRQRRRARAGQGERQGPARPLLGVDRGADDAGSATRDPLRPADCSASTRCSPRSTRSRSTTSTALAAELYGARARSRRPASAPTRTASARPLAPVSEALTSYADAACLTRSASQSPAPRAGWARRSARRSRPPTGSSSAGGPIPSLGTELGGRARRGRRRRRLHRPRHRARQRPRLPARRRHVVVGTTGFDLESCASAPPTIGTAARAPTPSSPPTSRSGRC